jgi:ABC-2 type transport system permease protein
MSPFDFERLWRERRTADLKDTLPYMKYVIGSGFGLLIAAAFIVAIQGYIVALREAEQSGSLAYPLEAIGAVLLTSILLWNPLRSYLTEADTIFLTPAESRMEIYFRAAKRLGTSVSGLIALSVLLLIAPYYLALGGVLLQYMGIAAAIMAMKALLYYGAWKERQFESRSLRFLFLIVKIVAVFATVYALLRSSSLLPAFLIFLVVWIAYALSLRIPRSFLLNWEGLIREERRTREMVERWFSQFVDRPTNGETYKRRGYLQPILSLVSPAFGKGNPYHYLFWRRLLRSSLFMIVLRLLILYYLFLFLFPGRWIAVLLFALFALFIGAQLKSLRPARSEVIHLAVATVPEQESSAAIRAIRRMVHGFCILLMAVPLLFIFA